MTTGSSLVVDSHAFIWYLQASPRLSDKARQAMDDATAADVPLMISAATLVELVYHVEKGTFSEADVGAFHEILDAADSGFEVAPHSERTCRCRGHHRSSGWCEA